MEAAIDANSVMGVAVVAVAGNVVLLLLDVARLITEKIVKTQQGSGLVVKRHLPSRKIVEGVAAEGDEEAALHCSMALLRLLSNQRMDGVPERIHRLLL